jgi:hypothetical protein
VRLVLQLVLDTLVVPVLPVGIAVGFALVVKSEIARRLAAGLAVGAGILIAHFVTLGVPRLPPVDTIGWITLATAAASLALLAERHDGARFAFILMLTSATVWLVGLPLWASAADIARWPLATGVVAAAVVASLDIASRRMSSGAPLLAFSFTLAGSSLALLFGHSARLAQVLGASAAVVGAAGLAAFFFPPPKAIWSIAVLSGAAVMVYGRFYATVQMPVLLLVVASAAAPLVASRVPRRRAAAAITVAVVPAAAAVFWARG